MECNLCPPRGEGAVSDKNADCIGIPERGCAGDKSCPRSGQAKGQEVDMGLNGQNLMAAIREYLGHGKSRAFAQIVGIGFVGKVEAGAT